MDYFAAVGYISLVGSAILVVFSRVPKQTITDQRELINTIQEQRAADKEQADGRIKALEDQHAEDMRNHLENSKAIAELQGQVKIYKELALNDLADSMKKISTSNEAILELLSRSNIISSDNIPKP